VEASELVEVTIQEIRINPELEHRVVILRANGDERILPIWIGPFEADAIKMALEGTQPDRPMTHDLTIRLLTSLGAQVRQVVVNKIVDNTFYAEITTMIGEQQHLVDARPSDALALAVRAGVPIYAARGVLDYAGGPDDDAFWMAMAEKVRQFHARASLPDEAQQPIAE
jgi:uncharacterized protein